MTGISQHGLSLLSMDSLLEMSSCAVRTFLIMAAGSAVLVGTVIWVSRIIQSKTVKRLQGLPYIREHFPFQQQWILMNACDQPMAPVGFSTMVFATVRGFHAVFQRFGRYVVYLGFRPLVILFKAEYVEVSVLFLCSFLANTCFEVHSASASFLLSECFQCLSSD